MSTNSSVFSWISFFRACKFVVVYTYNYKWGMTVTCQLVNAPCCQVVPHNRGGRPVKKGGWPKKLILHHLLHHRPYQPQRNACSFCVSCNNITHSIWKSMHTHTNNYSHTNFISNTSYVWLHVPVARQTISHWIKAELAAVDNTHGAVCQPLHACCLIIAWMMSVH